MDCNFNANSDGHEIPISKYIIEIPSKYVEFIRERVQYLHLGMHILSLDTYLLYILVSV